MVSISVPAYFGVLMHFPSPVMRRRMGRPALNLEETKVRLNAGMKDRVIALVGEQRMASYIREAVEERLRRDEEARERTKPKPE
jgi:hypothetical protein